MNFSKNWAIIILLLVGYSIWYFSYNFTRGIVPSSSTGTWYILESSKIQEAYTYLEKYYYSFSDKTLEEREDALIDALTKSLWDKHTSYFNPKDAEEFVESLSWDFEGIGAVIQEHPKGIQIMKVLDNSPAKKSNLIKWDVILKINTTSTIGMLAEDAVEIIRGPKWSTVTLTVLSGTIEREVKIERDHVIVPSVQGDFLSGSTIGYIEVGFFWENTTQEFTRTLESLLGSGAEGIIIDGRNNWGGYLDSSVDILSTILPDNQLVVATRGIRPSENMDYKTQKRKIQNTQIPIVMVVNSMSASATEIVAGALQDYDRAIIVGEKTYGKWSVQEPFILSDGSMMKITVAKWFTPKDRWIDEKWIEPDVMIDLTDDDYKNIYDRQLEWARVLLQDIIENQSKISEYKKNTEKINTLLQEKKIYE